ncbi:MAG: sigma-70 family RNA polymerase sigma factor, partial [Candidatus Aminicenantes bacterium]|nr:sigma-70 family RNA polymerase sigma factor [Candidatus Aminicenantes bacterium]
VIKRLIEGNLRFVVKYASKFKGYGVPFEDLVEEGVLGLIEAAKRFDPNKNVKFLSYAGWWVREAILEAIHRGTRAVDIPKRMMDAYFKVQKKAKDLEKLEGKPPSKRELAEELGMDEERLDNLMLIKKTDISLSSSIEEDETLSIESLIPDQEEDVVEKIFRKRLREKVKEIIESLGEREAKIIKLRYGLEDGRPRTLEEIGREVGLSKERVRQIEKRALRKLRHNETLKSIKGSLN